MALPINLSYNILVPPAHILLPSTYFFTSLLSIMSENDQLIESFVAVTNASRYLAEQYLRRNDNDLTTAIEDYYSSNGASVSPEPQDVSRSHRAGVRTLRDLGNESDDPDDKTNANFFTGGEKSALQVENPNKDKKNDNDPLQPSLIERIFQRARDQMQEHDDRPSARDEEETPRHFSGTGIKLGDSATPLELQPQLPAHAPRVPSKVSREITFWRQGFTVGDGPLQRYDDPENQQVLQELKNGRVPVSVLGVEFGQDVDVSVIKKTEEDYTPPKRKLGGFLGHGQRLGSPVPGEASPTPTIESPAPEKAKPSDEGTGDSPVQIRFANGKRVAHKFNSTDSISVVYLFVRHHELNDAPLRAFILSHAFPVKPIEELDGVTVAEAQLKNATIIQRWK